MTQRILETSVGEQRIKVLMGWDRPLQYHFMVIEREGKRDPLYSNLDDPSAGLHGSLQYFIGKALDFGIEIPPGMVARLEADRAANLGNALSRFNAHGVEVHR